MLKLTRKQERNVIIGWLGLWAIISFVAVFLITQVILSEWDKAYGYLLGVNVDVKSFAGLAMPVYANVSLNGTEVITPENNGEEVDNYVKAIKDDVCETLQPNKTAVEECYGL